MKKASFALLIFLLAGCTYGTEQIKTLVADPHYAKYQEKLNHLEKSYLDTNITYSEYLEKKQQLEDDYTKEVKEREDIIHQN